MKKALVKKWFAASLAAVMVISALSGCNKSDKDKGESSSVSGDTTQSIFTPIGTYPIVNEPITISMFMTMATQSDFETNTFSKYLEELTGIDIRFESAPADAAAEKMNLLLTSGDYPDCFMSSVPDDARYGVEEGILVDLLPLLQYMPNYNEKLKTEGIPDIIAQKTCVDGKMYILPGYSECFHCTYSGKLWANMKHIEDMGEKVPTTTEEFYNLLKKFKSLNPKNVPLVGATTSWNGDPFLFLSNSFLYNGGDKYGFVLKDSSIIETISNTNEYREALLYLNKIYDEGLMDASTYTTVGDQLKALVASDGEPVLFVAEGAIVGLADVNTTPELYSHYYPISPLKGPNGVQNAAHFPAGSSGRFAITKACKYPEAAVRMVDYFFTTDGWLTSQFGEKGVGWEDAPEGTVGMNGKPAIYNILKPYSVEIQNDTWQDRGTTIVSSDFNFGDVTDPDLDLYSAKGLEALLYKTTKEVYMPYAPKGVDTLPTIKLTPDESAQIQTIGVEVEKYINESKVQFITGALDIEDDQAWATYLKGIEDMGMPTLLKVYQAGYDRQYK